VALDVLLVLDHLGSLLSSHASRSMLSCSDIRLSLRRPADIFLSSAVGLVPPAQPRPHFTFLNAFDLECLRDADV
jgi:hypothetical protein